MKLTEFLSDVGRPVAYYPELKKITGSTTATILLCQFIYWRGKEADPDGWLKKSSEDIEKETGLTYNEQKTARKLLIAAGLMEEFYARLDHDMKFLLNLDEINRKWGTLKGNVPERDDSTFGNDGLPYSLNSNTEITTETTTQKGSGLSEKDLQQVNAKVDYILENQKKVKYQNRDKLPEPYLVFADLYNELTGQEPTKRSIQEWMMTFEDWKQEGLQSDHIRAAWQYANRPEGGFPVGRPSALTNTAVAMKSKGLMAKITEKVLSPIEQAMRDLQKASVNG